MTNQPAYWKPFYPAYNSLAGWEFEKQLAYDLIRTKLRFDRLTRMESKATELRRLAYIAQDTMLLCKYADIEVRIMEARNRAFERLVYDFKEQVEL